MPRFRPTGGARRQLDRNLARFARQGSEQSRIICQFIVDTIRADPGTPYDATTPDDHGKHLRDSYRVRRSPNNPDAWVITTPVRYWAFVEFGTREHGRAQPHIRPAVELARQVFD